MIKDRLSKPWPAVKFIAIVLLMMGALWANAGEAPHAGIALAVVNGDTIYSNDIDRLLINVHGDMSSAGLMNFDHQKLLNKLVNDRLIIQEATAMGMSEEDWLLLELNEIRERAAMRYFVREKFSPDLQIPEIAIREYFEKFYRRLHVRSLAVESEDYARELAEQVRSGASMDSLATIKSLDMYRYKGGLRNNIYYADTEVPVRDAAEKLAVGEVSDPFPYRSVFAFIRLEGRSAADSTELGKFRASIESVLQGEKKARLWGDFLDSLRRQFSIIVDSTALLAVESDSSALYTPEFMEGTEDSVLVSANGYVITSDKLRKAISYTAMGAGDQNFDYIFRTGLEKATNDLLLTSGAAANGYLEDPRVDEIYRHSLDSALIESYLQQMVVAQIKFTHAELDDYYNEHIDEYREPTRYQLDRMTVDNEDTAQIIYQRLKEGADFSYIASQFNANLAPPEECAEWLSILSFPHEISTEITGLRIGQSTMPHRTTEGNLILKVKARREGEPKPRNEVELDVRDKVFQRKFGRSLDRILEVLKSNSQIVYFQEAIDNYFGASR